MDKIATLEVRWTQGFTNKSIDFVDNETVCYPCGNHICFLNVETKKQLVFQTPGRGVSVLAARGSTGTFAFSEEKLSPSIFVYVFPDLHLKNELKGTAQLDYTCLTLSNGGPYLACCSSLPDHSITVWNWETAEVLCMHSQAGKEVISLVFNPLNWLQFCALSTTSITVWNIEKSGTFHMMKPSLIELPVGDGSSVKCTASTSHIVKGKLHFSAFGTPTSTNSRLQGGKSKPRLTPSAICWTATSKLYVGCNEGFLLLIDPDNLFVSILLNPTTGEAIPELRNGNFQGLSLNKNKLFAVGKDNTMHCLQIKGTEISITQTWLLERHVTTLTLSPDCKTLLLSSSTGVIYKFNQTQSDKVVKVLDVLSGSFVTAALLHTQNNFCVSLRQSGELQLWASDGICNSSLSLQTEVTSLACCPIAHYVAVGTASGNVLFFDLNKDVAPRLVHQVSLYHTAVDHLVFDQEGHFLLTGASDPHMYILNAKPSRMFKVIGYTVVPGCILSLSTQCITDHDKVKVLILCAEQEDRNHGGSILEVLSLPAASLKGAASRDRYGCLSHDVFEVSRYKVPHSIQSCVLGIDEVFAYCHKNKMLQRFQLPQFGSSQETDGVSNQQVSELTPQQEVRAHQLGPAYLALSPHSLWLASVGRDGLLRIRETSSMEKYTELQCHSLRLGGVRSVCFSPDGLMILTTGFDDDSLVCSHLSIEVMNFSKKSEARRYSRSMADYLKFLFDVENTVLTCFPVRQQEFSAGIKKQKVSEVSAGTSVDDSSGSPKPSHLTWLESRREAVFKEDNELYSKEKKQLRETIDSLRDAIHHMISENEEFPENHFNLDLEEQKRLDAMVEQEVTRVRDDIKHNNLKKSFFRDILKRECWDSLKVKDRSIKAFHSEIEVQNYPLKERTEKDLEDLRRVENTRKLEMAACAGSKTETEEKGEDHEADRFALTGSFSAQLGYSNPHIYDQFSLQTTEQRINQIVLVQDVIYRIKTAFNADFQALHNQKVLELNRVKDRNKHIRDLMTELDQNEELWEPSLTTSEQPERLITVEDSEIKAEKYITPEQREEEERRKLEELRRLAAQDDAGREKALYEMMSGVIDVKNDQIFKMEIPVPEFVLSKPDTLWSEEEKKIYKDYEKKVKDLNEEKDKYRRALEIEIKRLHEFSRDATKRFDDSLHKLMEKKMKCTVAIYQEELKITYLVESLLMEEEIRKRELALKLKLEKMEVYKEELMEELKKREEDVELFCKAYEAMVEEDKELDKKFRKDFIDLPNTLVDTLYKLFKRRPRAQKMRAQTDNNPTPMKEPRASFFVASEALLKTFSAMEALDAPENMPDGLNQSVWERLCIVRRVKIESEYQVKLKALILAEMQAFLHRRKDEDKAAEQEIKTLKGEIESVHKKKNQLMTDATVQIILKQGQVDVSTTGLTDNNDLILYHRSVVDELRGVIRGLGQERIATMEKRKNVRKGMIQVEWEHKVLRKKREDLNERARSIKMLRLTEEQREMTQLSKKDQNFRMTKQIVAMEKNFDLMKKTHLQSVRHCVEKAQRINRLAEKKAQENANFEQQLPNMQVTVAELKNICDETAFERDEATHIQERHQELVQKSNLEELARQQAQELIFLSKEVERLTRKNFPSLDQLKHS